MRNSVRIIALLVATFIAVPADGAEPNRQGAKPPAAASGDKKPATKAPDWSYSLVCSLIEAREDIRPELKHVVFVEILSPTDLKITTTSREQARNRDKGIGHGCYVYLKHRDGKWAVANLVPWET